MKRNILFFALVLAGLCVITTLAISCGGKKAEQATQEHHHAEGDSTNHEEAMPMDSAQTVFACPMHPDVTGKEGEKCSKCGMPLETMKDTDAH